MSNNTFREPTSYERAVLVGLQRREKHVYAGTVPAGVVAERRAKNRAARAARRLNRGRR